ncbi:MAG: conjugal transfer protein, partial [Methylobacter sp.]|nr:conjugal transfer protein [Methylobacter sp.]
MKSDYDYQFPWRPIFEITAITGWIGGAALAYLTSQWSGLPQEPFVWLMRVCGVMVLWRLPPTLSLWYRKRRLR